MAKPHKPPGGMIFSIDRNTVTAALKRAVSVVPAKSIVPILQFVHLTAAGDGLRIAATNMDMSISEIVAAEVERKGEVCVTGRRLAAIVEACPAGSAITFEASSAELVIRCGRARYQMMILPSEDFPGLKMDAFDARWSMPAKQICDMLGEVMHAAWTDDSRLYLNGVFLHALNGRTLAAVATDGHRLARRGVPLPAGAENVPPVLLPLDSVGVIAKLCGRAGEVTVSLNRHLVQVEVSQARLVSKLIDATFPDYQRVIPDNWNARGTVPAADFTAALARIIAVLDDAHHGICVRFAQGRIDIGASNRDVGQAQETVDADYDGPTVEIGVNAGYLREACAAAPADLQFSIVDFSTPVQIAGHLPDDLEIVMPMQVPADVRWPSIEHQAVAA
jgi:DNA polymerase III subunit beta